MAAGEVEAIVIKQMRTMLRTPEIIVNTWQADGDVSERDVGEALRRLDPVWEELFPVEQQRLVQLLIGQVDMARDGVQVHLRSGGLGFLAHQLGVGKGVTV